MFSGESPEEKSNAAAVFTWVMTGRVRSPPVAADADGAETRTAVRAGIAATRVKRMRMVCFLCKRLEGGRAGCARHRCDRRPRRGLAWRPFWDGDPGRGISVKHLNVRERDGDRDALVRLRDQAEDGTISLRAALPFNADDAAAAHTRIEQGALRERIVLTFDHDN